MQHAELKYIARFKNNREPDSLKVYIRTHFIVRVDGGCRFFWCGCGNVDD